MYTRVRSIISLVMNKVITFCKNNAVLVLSGVLALISCFFVHPDAQYASYINTRVLSILFCLMLVVSCLVDIGTFDLLTAKLLSKVRSSRAICLILTALAFVLSMFMTNDVTLVTVVPFAIMLLKPLPEKRTMMNCLILVTVAANLGSMLTPVGNPQNLYLFDHYKMTLPGFLGLTFPYSLMSLVLIIAGVFILCRKADIPAPDMDNGSKKIPVVKLILCIVLFILSLLTVANLVHYLIVLPVTIAVILILDRKAFKGVDYNLLITFVFFFILTGNLGRIESISNAIRAVADPYPVVTAILTSQIISNVPAAMLLSVFTEKGTSLVIGTNLGGLGTLIASMASLITYRFYAKLESKDKPAGKGSGYVLWFSLVNVIMLVILFLAYLLISRISA